MNDIPGLKQFLEIVVPLTEQLQAKLSDPWFWSQFAIIAVIFGVSRWLLTPGFKRGLNHLASKVSRFGNLRRVLLVVRELGNTVTWLLLQWVAIGVVGSQGWPHTALTIVASLLSAWILIRVATMLVENPSIARIVSIFAWSVAALNIFGWLEPTMAVLDSWAIESGNLRISILTVIKGGLALWFALWIANGVSGLVERQLGRSSAVSPAMRVLSGKLVRLTLITIAILMALSAVGIDLTALAVFSGALGVGLGFGLQKIFSNLVSGMILLMDRSIKPGDVISVGPTVGWINHLSARYASVITRDGVEHLIPNEELITQRVENWSFSNNLVRLRIPVGISYHADPRLAMGLCVEAALEVARVKKDPEPRCQMTGFGDSSVDLELRIWIDDPPNGLASVRTDIYLGIWDRFQQHGIEIPFPQRDLHLRSAFGTTNPSELHAAWAGPGNADEASS